MLRLKWRFRNEEKNFDPEKLKPKSTFNPCNKDAAIVIYMSGLEEKLMKIEIPKDKFNNLTTKERKALYDLKNDKNIIIKGADKGSAVVVWDREDCIKEAEKQLEASDVYEEVPDGAEPLISTIHTTLEKIRKRRDLEILDFLSGSLCAILSLSSSNSSSIASRSTIVDKRFVNFFAF